jgi:uncharacterized membrane protein
MAGNNAFLIFLSMIGGQAPVLIVYLVGAILAIKWWRRYPRPALLVLVGIALHVATSITYTAVHVYLITNRPPGGLQSLSTVFAVMSLTSAVLHASASALLIWAAFAGRRPADDVGFPVSAMAPRYAAAPPPPPPLTPPLRS